MTTSPLLLDIPRNETWLDVSGIARGVGFTTAVQVSVTLNDALQPLQNEMDEMDEDHDQRLYDCLWRAHFKLSLDRSQAVTFNFTFPRKDWKTGEVSESSLRVRVEAQKSRLCCSACWRILGCTRNPISPPHQSITPPIVFPV